MVGLASVAVGGPACVRISVPAQLKLLKCQRAFMFTVEMEKLTDTFAPATSLTRLLVYCHSSTLRVVSI